MNEPDPLLRSPEPFSSDPAAVAVSLGDWLLPASIEDLVVAGSVEGEISATPVSPHDYQEDLIDVLATGFTDPDSPDPSSMPT